MKIFGWMQSKLTGKKGAKNQDLVSPKCNKVEVPGKEEFSDWPHGFLAIGTFGNKNLVENQVISDFPGSQSSTCNDYTQDTIYQEEAEAELQNELESLFQNQISDDLPEEQLRGCLDSEFDSSVVISRGREVHSDQPNSALGKKSVSFLLKKIFLCRNGFAPTPGLRECSVPELRLEKSRMEKVLRAILQKKIYPQSSSPKATTTKKYIENKFQFNTNSTEDETLEKETDGSKWVKTDSEYIVLEI